MTALREPVLERDSGGRRHRQIRWAWIDVEPPQLTFSTFGRIGCLRSERGGEVVGEAQLLSSVAERYVPQCKVADLVRSEAHLFLQFAKRSAGRVADLVRIDVAADADPGVWDGRRTDPIQQEHAIITDEEDRRHVSRRAQIHASRL